VKKVEHSEPVLLDSLSECGDKALESGSQTVDELLGSGIVPGATILLGGEPGVGKSTFLLQLMAAFHATGEKGLYISGEESLSQLKKRASRLGLLDRGLLVLSTKSLETILEMIESPDRPRLLVIDSIQTMMSTQAGGIAGSVSQIKAVASELIEYGKRYNVSLLLVGHVTKDGHIAGPKLLEHMVDTVLYMEGDKQLLYRMVRVVKNRFGPTDMVMVLQMQAKGLQIIHDPSTFFLDARDPSLSGTALLVALEGQRPFVVEVQALVSKSFFPMPRRTALGFDTNRLHLLVALLEKKLHLSLGSMDIYAKIGGGLKLQEPSLDLGVTTAVLSSFFDKTLPERSVFWGEVDLNGQVRPVSGQDIRLKQAHQLGYAPIVSAFKAGRSQRSAQLPSGCVSIANILQLKEHFFP
jgi:DNA repair protein RadA/Sms